MSDSGNDAGLDPRLIEHNANVSTRLVNIPTEWDDLVVERLVVEAIASGKTKAKRSSMQIGEYNGFSREVRLDADWKIKVAQEFDWIPRPTKCCVCGAEHTDVKRMDYHAEDYGRPLKVAPICSRCHLALHNRLRGGGWAAGWAKKVQEFGDGTKWFEFI